MKWWYKFRWNEMIIFFYYLISLGFEHLVRQNKQIKEIIGKEIVTFFTIV